MRAIETMPAIAAPPPEPRGRLYFDAVLRPNRSLPNAGFIALMAGVGVLGLIAGLFYVMLGAWPVLGFFGLEFVLVWLAFRMSYRQGRLHERVRVWADQMLVARRHPSGHEQHWTVPSAWTRVDIDEPVRHHSQVRLSNRGKTLILGSFLAPEERGAFALALRNAIAAARDDAAEPAPQ